MVPFIWTTFLRKDHPARANWGLDAWQRWPHVQVNIAKAARRTLDTELVVTKVSRKIGALISEFASVGPLLARTNLLDTFPAILLAPDIDVYNLRPMAPPVAFPAFRVQFFWSARLANDPANQWIRTIVVQAYTQMHAEAEALVAAMLGRVD